MGSRQLAESATAGLRRAGVRRLFGLPGGGPNLDLIGAAHDLPFTLAHGETAACVMAGAFGLLTGTPGVAVVTRGPGVTSAANGLAQATLDRAPLLLVSDRVTADQRRRVAHQRLDQHRRRGRAHARRLPFWPVTHPRGLLISNGLATMGYALPAAIGAALTGARVVCLTGDGGLGMVLAELETVARLALPVTVVVFNDATLSLIAIKQGAGQGDATAVRYSAVDLAGAAAALGVPSAAVDSAADAGKVLRAAGHGPFLLDARVDPAGYRHLMAVSRG